MCCAHCHQSSHPESHAFKFLGHKQKRHVKKVWDTRIRAQEKLDGMDTGELGSKRTEEPLRRAKRGRGRSIGFSCESARETRHVIEASANERNKAI